MGGIESGIALRAKGICAYSCWTFAAVGVDHAALNEQSYTGNMKNAVKMVLACGLGMAVMQFAAGAADTKPAPPNTSTNAPKSSPKELKENISYAIGNDIGKNLKRSGVELDMEILHGALKEAMAGNPSKLTDAQTQEAFNYYRQTMFAKRDEERRKTGEKNRKEGEAFLAENKKKPGVKTHQVKLADGTMAEMQYKVITEGKGAVPKTNDMVNVNYRGTLISGKEFDSSAKHGSQPAKFQINRVVPGWTEALRMMTAGSKWELYLPASLAYGDQGMGAMIEPGSTLIFEMELVNTEAPAPPPPPPQPLTSDIIRVPSAEGLKKGEKIEVIKPEDLEKLTNAAAQKPAKK
jgi:FKBP-type peptidyl-prolyl cis-trans isomerase FklB